MLRLAIQILAFVLLLAAMGAVVLQPTTWPMLAGAGLLALGTLWERFYYRGAGAQSEGGRWQETAERFLDEETGRPVTVWFNPATGERRYVDQGAAPPG